MSRIFLKKLTENKIISNFKFGTFHRGKQHYYSLEQLKRQCSIYFSIQLPFQQMIPKGSLSYSLTCSKSGFIEMLDTKFKTVFFFPIQESIIFSRLKSYQKQIQRNLNKSRNQAFPITHSKCTCTVTKWPPGKKIYIYKCSLSACCSSKNCYVFVHILFSIFLVIIGTIGRKKVKAPPCLQIDQNKIGHTTHCRITCIIPLPPPR